MTMKPSGAGAFVSGVTTQSTTAQLAGQVPKESSKGAQVGVGGSPPDTPFHDAQEFKVDPIPATAGIGNPINLRPGEKVPDPSTFNSNTINSTVTTDKASYENGPSTTSSSQPSAAAGGAFGVLPVRTGQMIPESGLPMGNQASQGVGPTVQSAGAGTSTAALAGLVPKEPRGVPEIVQESQQAAEVGPEASANPEAVAEKSAMEKELEGKLPKDAATSGTIINDTPTTDAAAGARRMVPKLPSTMLMYMIQVLP